MPHGWSLLLDLAVTLAAAFLFGAVFERFRGSALLGYLLAGLILGPTATRVVQDTSAVQALAEIGIALLLFSIGLEFSWKRLRRMGAPALGGGTLQLLLTGGAAAAVALAFGINLGPAVAVGSIVALSSTAVVVQMLRDRNELDSLHGKNALGILLLQDVALVPLVLLLTFLGGSGGQPESLAESGLKAAKVVAVAIGFLFVVGAVLPRALLSRALARNRELPVLLAITTCIGAAYAAHSIGVSPSLGAFLAGMMLAESQYAEQIRADVGPLRTAFVTLFFASVGMLADIGWIGQNLALVFGVAAAVLVGKALLTAMALRIFKQTILSSFATGIAISQIGELSFVLIKAATDSKILNDDLDHLLTSVAVLTLLVSPFLVTWAPVAARELGKRLFKARRLAFDERKGPRAPKLQGHVIVVGYGDAGEAAVAELTDTGHKIVVMELNRRLLDAAAEKGHHTVLGDASQTEMLEAASIETARALVVAIPDHNAARIIIAQAHRCAKLPVVARARYHLVVSDLEEAGAQEVVDEETLVGIRLGRQTAKLIDSEVDMRG